MQTFNMVKENMRNQSLINYLNTEGYAVGLKFIVDEKQIEKHKLNVGTHPDVIEMLWGDHTKEIPIRCQAILLGRPVLVNPNTGIVFGLAEGTNPPLLRLPETDRVNLLEKGGGILLSDLDGVYANARDIGNDWIYCFSFIDNLEKYFLSAYKYSNNN